MMASNAVADGDPRDPGVFGPKQLSAALLLGRALDPGR